MMHGSCPKLQGSLGAYINTWSSGCCSAEDPLGKAVVLKYKLMLLRTEVCCDLEVAQCFKVRALGLSPIPAEGAIGTPNS